VVLIQFVRRVNLSLEEIINELKLWHMIKTLQSRCMMHYCPLMDHLVTACMLNGCVLHVLAEGVFRNMLLFTHKKYVFNKWTFLSSSTCGTDLANGISSLFISDLSHR